MAACGPGVPGQGSHLSCGFDLHCWILKPPGSLLSCGFGVPCSAMVDENLGNFLFLSFFFGHLEAHGVPWSGVRSKVSYNCHLSHVCGNIGFLTHMLGWGSYLHPGVASLCTTVRTPTLKNIKKIPYLLKNIKRIKIFSQLLKSLFFT